MIAHRNVLRSVLTALVMLFGLLTPALPAAAATPGVQIPQDESPHDTAREWWYYTGNLTGTDAQGGRHQYGYELVVFRSRVAYPDLAGYAGNLAVTDLTDDTFTWEAKVDVRPDTLPSGGGFDLTVVDWKTSGKGGADKIDAGFTDGSFRLQLNLSQTKPPALHGNLRGVKGLIPYGPWGESFYYSYTDLKTTGTIYDHGKPIAVTGRSWMDHQYGDFKTGYGQWDWYSIQLTNGSQYMVYLIADETGKLVEKIGTLIRPDGTTVDLDSSQLSDKALGSWTSPATGLTYSSGWRVNVPGGFFVVLPKRADQEVAWPGAPGGAYWEGASLVTGVINGQPVAGQGYTEVTTPGIAFD
ncbi:MAG: hypothetical protein QOI21_2171 [Actinomycetota bacterium]|jgi:predicted secreted hydrolase|nr:hypothetical protein [Actinomycetota bacterium]